MLRHVGSSTPCAEQAPPSWLLITGDVVFVVIQHADERRLGQAWYRAHGTRRAAAIHDLDAVSVALAHKGTAPPIAAVSGVRRAQRAVTHPSERRTLHLSRTASWSSW